MLPLLLVFFNVGTYAQSDNVIDFPTFLESKGMEIVAQAAHPLKYKFNQFLPDKSKCTVYHDQVVYNLVYLDGGITVVNVELERCIIKKITYKTNYFASIPFVSFQGMFVNSFGGKNNLQNDEVILGVVNYYENKFGKELTQFTGEELTIITLAWGWGKSMIKLNEQEPTSSMANSFVSKTVDGIVLKGTPEFIRRIEEGLKVIETYDPKTYDDFFNVKSGSPRLVKEITFDSDPRVTISTISTSGGIKLHKGYSYYHHNNYEEANQYELAATLIHEMTHLYQNYDYTRLYSLSNYGFYKVYSYDPILRSKMELEAYDVTASFLDKVMEKAVANKSVTGRLIQMRVNKILANNEKQKKYYSILWDAGRYLFLSRIEGSECGNSCKDLFLDRLKEYAKGGVAFESMAQYYRRKYP